MLNLYVKVVFNIKIYVFFLIKTRCLFVYFAL